MNRVIKGAVAALAFATMALPTAYAQDPSTKMDGSWISLSGIIAKAGDESFVLDYGKGKITVEMDDWDWYKEGKALIEGDNVTVYGRVDDDLYQSTTIEASSVYVKNLNTYFYASDADEEDLAFSFVTTPVVVAWMELTGTVTKIEGREFTLDTGNRTVRVDTSAMVYDPTDDQGYQKIRKGDRVKVSGNMDYDLFEKKELMANTIVTLAKDKTKKNQKKSG